MHARTQVWEHRPLIWVLVAGWLPTAFSVSLCLPLE